MAMVFDWARKMFGKKEEGEAYYLQYQPEGQRGWMPVERFAMSVDVKDVVDYMTEPGVYNLQKRVGGKIAGYAWDKPYTVKSSEGAEAVKGERLGTATESDKIALAIENDMMRAVRWFKLPEMIQGAIKKAFGGEVPFQGEGGQASAPGQLSLREQLAGMRKEYDDLGEIFGSKTDTQSKKIPVKGDIPAWLVYLPEITDQMADSFEKRLTRWGWIGETAPRQRLLEMPARPERTRRVDLKSIKKSKEGKVEEVGGGAKEQGD